MSIEYIQMYIVFQYYEYDDYVILESISDLLMQFYEFFLVMYMMTLNNAVDVCLLSCIALHFTILKVLLSKEPRNVYLFFFSYICSLVLAASNCIGVTIANKCHLIKVDINYCMKGSAINPSRIVATPKHLDFILGLAVKRDPL